MLTFFASPSCHPLRICWDIECSVKDLIAFCCTHRGIYLCARGTYCRLGEELNAQLLAYVGCLCWYIYDWWKLVYSESMWLNLQPYDTI